MQLRWRTFIRRMLDLAHSYERLHHWVTLTPEFKSDLQWWSLFLEKWNGRSCLRTHLRAPPDVVMVSDASGSWGCDALCQRRWLQLAWVADWPEQSITVKELLPIVLATAVWGRLWAGQRVLTRCDNMAVVHVLQSRTSRHPLVMYLFCWPSGT